MKWPKKKSIDRGTYIVLMEDDSNVVLINTILFYFLVENFKMFCIRFMYETIFFEVSIVKSRATHKQNRF